MAAMTAARMVARLAGPRPVRLLAVSSPKVTSGVMRLDGPVLPDQPGQVARAGFSAGQAGDGVGGFAGRRAGGGVLPPAADLDGLAGAGELQAADVGSLHGA